MSFLGGVTSDILGLPQGSFEKWLNAGPYLIDVEVPTPKPKAIKNPEIPVLKEIMLKIQLSFMLYTKVLFVYKRQRRHLYNFNNFRHLQFALF